MCYVIQVRRNARGALATKSQARAHGRTEPLVVLVDIPIYRSVEVGAIVHEVKSLFQLDNCRVTWHPEDMNYVDG